MASAPVRPAPALSSLARAGLIAALLALAAGAWVVTAQCMDGTDAGPGTALGGFG